MPRTLTPGDGQDVLARVKAARQKRDPDLIVEMLTEDAEFRPDPFEPAIAGSIAIREHWNRIVASQAHVDFDAERVWVAGSTVLSSWHAAFTRRADAGRVRERGFSTMELDDEGLVTRWREWTISRAVGTDANFELDASDGATQQGSHG